MPQTENMADVSGGEVERLMFAALLKRGIDQDTADQASQEVAAALSAMSRDDAGVVARLVEALREARPYVEQAGFRHHDVSGLLAKIDEALSSVGGEG